MAKKPNETIVDDIERIGVPDATEKYSGQLNEVKKQILDDAGAVVIKSSEEFVEAFQLLRNKPGIDEKELAKGAYLIEESRRSLEVAIRELGNGINNVGKGKKDRIESDIQKRINNFKRNISKIVEEHYFKNESFAKAPDASVQQPNTPSQPSVETEPESAEQKIEIERASKMIESFEAYLGSQIERVEKDPGFLERIDSEIWAAQNIADHQLAAATDRVKNLYDRLISIGSADEAERFKDKFMKMNEEYLEHLKNFKKYQKSRQAARITFGQITGTAKEKIQRRTKKEPGESKEDYLKRTAETVGKELPAEVTKMLEQLNMDIKRQPGESDEDFKKRVAGESNEKFLEVTRRVWTRIATHGILQKDSKTGEVKIGQYSDLDGKTCIALLRTAGINPGKIKFVKNGEEVDGYINFDTGEKLGVNLSDDWETATLDHHVPDAINKTSATEITYETLVELGLLNTDDYLVKNSSIEFNYLERLVRFVTECDNRDYPVTKKSLNESWQTLRGLGRFLNFQEPEIFEMVKEFFKKGGNPDKTLTQEYLVKLGFADREDFLTKTKLVYEKDVYQKGKPAKDGQGNKLKQKINRLEEQQGKIEQSVKEMERLEKEGFIINSKYGKLAVDIGSQVGIGVDAFKAYGCDTFIRWNPHSNSFFISTKKPFEDDFNLPSGNKIRGVMWAKNESDQSPLNFKLKDILKGLCGEDFKPEPDSELAKYLASESAGTTSAPEVTETDNNEQPEVAEETPGVETMEVKIKRINEKTSQILDEFSKKGETYLGLMDSRRSIEIGSLIREEEERLAEKLNTEEQLKKGVLENEIVSALIDSVSGSIGRIVNRTQELIKSSIDELDRSREMENIKLSGEYAQMSLDGLEQLKNGYEAKMNEISAQDWSNLTSTGQPEIELYLECQRLNFKDNSEHIKNKYISNYSLLISKLAEVIAGKKDEKIKPENLGSFENPLYQEDMKRHDPIRRFMSQVMGLDPDQVGFSYRFVSAKYPDPENPGGDKGLDMVADNYHDYLKYRSDLSDEQKMELDIIWQSGGISWKSPNIFANGDFWKKLNDPEHELHQHREKFMELMDSVLDGKEEDEYAKAVKEGKIIEIKEETIKILEEYDSKIDEFKESSESWLSHKKIELYGDNDLTDKMRKDLLECAEKLKEDTYYDLLAWVAGAKSALKSEENRTDVKQDQLKSYLENYFIYKRDLESRFNEDKDPKVRSMRKKEIAKTVIATAVSTVASIFGAKSAYDVPKYLQEKTKAILTKRDIRKSLDPILANLSKEGISETDLKNEKIGVGKVIDLDKIEQIEDKIESLNVSEKTKNELLESLNGLVENYRREKETLEQGKNEKFKGALNEYVTTKISGMQAIKEASNTLLVLSGSFALRGVSYSLIDGVNRYLKIRKENKVEAKKSKTEAKKVGLVKEVIVGAVKEAWQEIRRQDQGGKKTWTRKTLDQVRALGLIARYAGFTASYAHWGDDTTKAIDLLSARQTFSNIGQNFQGNYERILGFYKNVVTAPFTGKWGALTPRGGQELEKRGAQMQAPAPSGAKPENFTPEQSVQNTLADQNNALKEYGVSFNRVLNNDELEAVKTISKNIGSVPLLKGRIAEVLMALENGGLGKDEAESFMAIAGMITANPNLKFSADDLIRMAGNNPDRASLNQLKSILEEKALTGKGGGKARLREAILGNIKETGEIGKSLGTVYKGEGIEHSIRRQLEIDLKENQANHPSFKGDVNDARAVHKWSGQEAHRLALHSGYVDVRTGSEIRVSVDSKASFMLTKDNSGKMAVSEYFKEKSGKFAERASHNVVSDLKDAKFIGRQKADYEYISKAGKAIAPATEQAVGRHQTGGKSLYEKIYGANEVSSYSKYGLKYDYKHWDGRGDELWVRDQKNNNIIKVIKRISGENDEAFIKRAHKETDEFVSRAEMIIAHDLGKSHNGKSAINLEKMEKAGFNAYNLNGADKEKIVFWEAHQKELATPEKASQFFRLSQRTGLDYHSPAYLRSFNDMPKDISSHPSRSAGFMKTFAGPGGRTGEGLKDLLTLRGEPMRSEWSRESDTIVLRDAYGKKGFNLTIQRNQGDYRIAEEPGGRKLKLTSKNIDLIHNKGSRAFNKGEAHDSDSANNNPEKPSREEIVRRRMARKAAYRRSHSRQY